MQLFEYRKSLSASTAYTKKQATQRQRQRPSSVTVGSVALPILQSISSDPSIPGLSRTALFSQTPQQHITEPRMSNLSNLPLRLRGGGLTDSDEDDSYDEGFALPVRTRTLVNSDESDGDESELSESGPASTRRARTDPKTLPVHYLCPHYPDCQVANRIASNLSAHWKKKHADDGPWIVANAWMSQDGQVFRYGDRHLHPSPTKPSQAGPQKGFDDESILRRATAQVASGSIMDEYNISARATQIWKDRPMSIAELDESIAAHKEALANLTPEKIARRAVTGHAAEKAESRAVRLAHKLHKIKDKLYHRGDGTSYYKYNPNDRERSPEKQPPQTGDASSYRSRSPVPGGILRQGPPSPIRNFFDKIKKGKIPKRTPSLKSVKMPSKYGGVKAPDEDVSSAEESESSVSVEE